MPGDLNLPSGGDEKPGQKVKKSGLSGTVWPQKGAKFSGINAKADIAESLFRTVAVAEVPDFQPTHSIVISMRWVSPVVPGIFM